MNLKSIVELEIDKPREEVAALFADPGNNSKWMQELERCEPIGGDQGMPGSSYRLVPKDGGMAFVAMVVERKLPDAFRLNLEGATVDVAIKVTFASVSSTRTKLVSEEVFTFKSGNNAVLDPARQDAIKAVHRRHIEGFKSFAEHY